MPKSFILSSKIPFLGGICNWRTCNVTDIQKVQESNDFFKNIKMKPKDTWADSLDLCICYPYITKILIIYIYIYIYIYILYC